MEMDLNVLMLTRYCWLMDNDGSRVTTAKDLTVSRNVSFVCIETWMS